MATKKKTQHFHPRGNYLQRCAGRDPAACLALAAWKEVLGEEHGIEEAHATNNRVRARVLSQLHSIGRLPRPRLLQLLRHYMHQTEEDGTLPTLARFRNLLPELELEYPWEPRGSLLRRSPRELVLGEDAVVGTGLVGAKPVLITEHRDSRGMFVKRSDVRGPTPGR